MINKVSAVTLPLSMLSTISLCILRRAVSVEWNRLYADYIKTIGIWLMNMYLIISC